MGDLGDDEKEAGWSPRGINPAGQREDSSAAVRLDVKGGGGVNSYYVEIAEDFWGVYQASVDHSDGVVVVGANI